MKHDMYELPESLYEFAQIYDFHGVIENLAAMAEDEDWNYHNTTGASNLPILENYIRNTYGNMYRASTCLTLDQAMNNARLLARPDRDWLNP